LKVEKNIALLPCKRRTHRFGKTGSLIISVGGTGQDGMMAQWSALLPHSARDLGSIQVTVWILHILPVSAWVCFGCSGFLPQFKDIGLIGHAKLPLCVRGLAG